MFTCTSILDQLHNTELCVLQFCRLWLHLLFSMTSVGVYRRHIITDAVKVGTYTSHNLTVIIVTLLCFLNWPTVHMYRCTCCGPIKGWGLQQGRVGGKLGFTFSSGSGFCLFAAVQLFKVFFVFFYLVLMSWALPPLWSVLSFLSSFFRNGSWLFRISSILIGLFILAASLLTSCLYLSTRKVRLATK